MCMWGAATCSGEGGRVSQYSIQGSVQLDNSEIEIEYEYRVPYTKVRS